MYSFILLITDLYTNTYIAIKGNSMFTTLILTILPITIYLKLCNYNLVAG